MKHTYTIQDFSEFKAAGSPSFNPDASLVAYLSNETGTTQLYVMPSEGGQAMQLTQYPDPISFARFSPTENKIVFGKSEGGNEQTQLFYINLDTNEIHALTTRADVRHDFGGWSQDGKYICYSSTERNGTDFDIYVVDVETLERKCVFNEGGWCRGAGFSPKGTYVIVQKAHSNTNNDLYLCNLRTGAIEHITPHAGSVCHTNPRWLPDESAFFLTKDEGREFMGVGTYHIAHKEFTYLLTPEWDIDGTAISTDGSKLAVIVNENGYYRAYVYNPETLEKLPYELPFGNISTTHFSQDGTKLAIVVDDSVHTKDIWVMSLENGTYHQLTHSAQAVPAEALVQPELISFTSFDGLSVPAFIYRPKEIVAGTTLPVLILIHGGPEEQYQPVLSSIVQYFVYSGYIVVAPNVRGSSGYGKTYLALDDVEKRMDSVKDIVALHEYLKSNPDADENRVALMGASYGGFMVLAGLAFYPHLWAAGIDIVGIGNFVSFLENTAPYRRAMREAEYGSLAHDRELLERISPFNSAEAIQAPLLVIHGANDPRVPLSEAEQLVSKLTELGREVELLVYPDEGHGLSKLQNRLDAYPKVAAFLQKALSK